MRNGVDVPSSALPPAARMRHVTRRCAEGYAPVINRWWRVLGAVLMNLAFGSLAAWSVFVAPLEKELHWRRAQTSWVFPIAIAAFAASLIVAGYLQDKFGPFRISLTGAILLGAGFLLASCIGGLVSL